MIYIVGRTDTPDPSQFQPISFQEAHSVLSTAATLYLDIETTGLNFLSDSIVTVQISHNETDQYIFFIEDDTRRLDAIIQLLSKAKTLVGHNLKFDLKFLKRYGLNAKQIYDTYICEQILTAGTQSRNGLKHVVQRYCSVDIDKSHQKSFTVGCTLSSPLLQYAALDVAYLPIIMHQQIDLLKEHNLLYIADLENAAVLAFMTMEYNGIGLDIDKWKSQVAIIEQEAKEIELEMNHIVDTDDTFVSVRPDSIQLSLFGTDENVSNQYRWDSPAATLDIFHCIDSRIISTSDQVLQKLRSKHKLAGLLQQYREKSKKASSFGTSFLSHIYSDGRIHPSFMQLVSTGRTSCREPNMQQIPADNTYRNCFISGSDWVFVSGDYSSQELCIIAHGSQDPVFLESLTKGHDLHSVCGELVFGQDWVNAAEEDCAYMAGKEKCNCKKHKELRNVVKGINFGLAYGMGPKKLSEQMEIPMQEASDLIDKYFKAFPAIKKFLDSMSKSGVRRGYIETFAPWSRKRWFPEWEPSNMPMAIKARIERQAKNTPIQGTAADMTKHALVLCHKYLEESNFPAKLVLTVHDQIDTICHPDYAEDWKQTLQLIMEKAAKYVMKNDLLKAEVNITKHWSK